MSSEIITPRPWQRRALAYGSDLPMVWSGCLAGVWLGGYWPGNERWDRLIVLLLCASALYAAGMFVEAAFQLQTGPVGQRMNVLRAAGLLAVGLALAGYLGWWPLAFAGTLSVSLVFATLFHDTMPVSLALVGAGRAMLYLLASSASATPALVLAAVEGVLLGLYFVGAAVFSRGERSSSRWPWGLIVLPLAINAVLSARLGPSHLVVLALPAFWLARVAFGRNTPSGVTPGTALRVGGVLMDLGAVLACAPYLPWLGWFAILFVLALVMQRIGSAAWDRHRGS